jgi:hypothetical protein
LRSLRPDASQDQIEGVLRSTGLDTGGRPRIRLLDAANALRALPPLAQAANGEAEVSASMQPVLAELQALPAGQPVRLIVGAAVRPGETPTAAVARAEAAARQAGASYVGDMGGQPMLVIEATPAQATALARSGAISSMQIDRAARTQP